MKLKMKISWIKQEHKQNSSLQSQNNESIEQENDNKSFITAEKLGLNVCKLENPEDVDSVIKQLINDNYKTIILSNEMAGFSEDIIKKYQNDSKVNIIITPRR